MPTVMDENQIEFAALFAPMVSRAGHRWRAANLIDGRWTQTRDWTVNASPIDGQPWLDVPKATAGHVDEAIQASLQARSSIRDIPAIERIELFDRAAALLEEHRELFRRLLVIEAGKPHPEAEGEVSATIERLRLTMQEVKKITGEYVPGDWAKDAMGKIAVVIHEPVGVIGAISPFNYPLSIAAAKLIPALLAGNSVVAKPASAVPMALLCFGRVLEEAGFSSGVVNVVTGSAEVGEQIVRDPRVDMISFTGSTDVGRRIPQAAGLKKLHLELGGKGMAIVLEDADLELAAERCVEGSLKNAGQRCDAVSAVLVVEAVADALAERMRTELAHWPVGDPRQRGVRVAP